MENILFILILTVLAIAVIWVDECDYKYHREQLEKKERGLVKINGCPFCNIGKERIIYENRSFIAIYDEYPVSKGHVLIISKDHKDRCFHDLYHVGLDDVEKLDLMEAIWHMQDYLSRTLGAMDFNVGWNNGELAGQTVNHFHCHVIPRYIGDTENPKGGIRGCIPEKMRYKIE